MKLLILSLCLNVATSILTVPNENYGVKKCVQNIIENAVPLDTTVLYVYDKVFDDVLPDKMQHPFLTFNISKKQYIVSGYRSYNEMVILYIKSASFLKGYLTKMRQHVWKFKSLAKRRYLIIYPSEEVSELKEIFSQFLELGADDVIVATYNSTLKKEAVKVFTWNPYHPSNKCGTIFNFRKEEFCSSVKMIENRRKLKNFNKCNMTYCYDVDRRYKKYDSEVAYVTNFLLEIMDQALNLTIVPSTGRRIIKGFNARNVFLILKKYLVQSAPPLLRFKIGASLWFQCASAQPELSPPYNARPVIEIEDEEARLPNIHNLRVDR
ncbi:hypothetical protein FQA39_LY06311 [Lamprigera yunnana]|nr:hypothetical protein FQA39_LY06311 [Lamprigera yunnana]